MDDIAQKLRVVRQFEIRGRKGKPGAMAGLINASFTTLTQRLLPYGGIAVRAHYKADSRKAVSLVVIALARVGDFPIVGCVQSPTPLSIHVSVEVEKHGSNLQWK